MNFREKLNEAAYEETNTGNPFEQFDTWYVRESFKHGADWLMQQPLSERLTDEEKEKIRGYYDNPGFSKFTREIADGLLVSIFGPDLFKEK